MKKKKNPNTKTKNKTKPPSNNSQEDSEEKSKRQRDELYQADQLQGFNGENTGAGTEQTHGRNPKASLETETKMNLKYDNDNVLRWGHGLYQ